METVFDSLITKKKEYNELVTKEGRKTFVKFFNQWFSEHPEIEAIRWAQYTPYYNDGDACIFGMLEIEVKPTTQFKNVFGEEPDTDDNFYDTHSFEKNNQVMVFTELQHILYSVEDVAEKAFGDHAQITVTRNGIEVEEYEHD